MFKKVFSNHVHTQRNKSLKYFSSAKNIIPQSTKSLVITKFGGDYEIKSSNIKQSLDEKEVLLKVHSFPINNLDILKIEGKTKFKPPLRIGSECSATIIASSNPNLLNKKVCYITQEGTSTEYIFAREDDLLFLNDDSDLTQNSVSFVNPLTAYGLIDIVEKDLKAKAFVQTNASSSLGYIINRLARAKGLGVVNVVRSQEKINELKENGFKNVLNLNEINFENNLKDLVSETKATAAIDSLSGNICGQIIKALPFGGTLISYGTQTPQPIGGIDPTDFRWGNKSLRSFVVMLWYNTKSLEEKSEIEKYLSNNIEDIFKQDIFHVDKVENFSDCYKQKKSAKHTGNFILSF